MLKVRSMIWDKFMSKSMKDKLEQLSGFSAKLSRDPVALLLAIKVQMHDTVRAQYSEWTRITAITPRFDRCSQPRLEPVGSSKPNSACR